MNTSESINELAAALAAAQGEMSGAVKSATNPHFRSSYSDLASVVEAIREPLSKHGLSYVQGLGQFADGCLFVTTRLLHSSGQWIESVNMVPVAGKSINAQALGSAATYGRRYGLQAIVGLPSVDDDGNSASAPEPAQAPEAPEAPEAPVKLDQDQVAQLARLLQKLPESVCDRLLAAYKVETVMELPQTAYKGVLHRLQEMVKEYAAAS